MTATPKTLDQAIKNALDLKQESNGDAIRAHVRDFLSQGFTAEMLEADDNTVRVLERLWKNITGEERV